MDETARFFWEAGRLCFRWKRL